MSFGGGNNDSTVTNQVTYTPEQKKILQAANPQMLQYLKNPPTIPNIQTVLPFNQLQQQGQAGTVAAAQGPLSNFTSGMMNASNWLNTGALNPDSNPWLRGTAEAAIRPVTENLTQNVLPNIRSQSYLDGFFGGSGQQVAESNAVNAASRNMLDTTGKIYSDAYQQGMDNMVKNLALSPQTAQLGLFPSQVISSVGDQQYAQATASAEDQYNRALLSQQMPWLATKDVLSTIMGLGTGSTSTSSGGGSSPLGSALTGGIGGAATAGALSGISGLGFLGGPWGIAAGAGLGALASIFS